LIPEATLATVLRVLEPFVGANKNPSTTPLITPHENFDIAIVIDFIRKNRD
jgi:hypothetical protein